MAVSDITFSITTFNMHGFNQGESFLIDLCNSNKCDIIFLQEHWLSDVNMHQILNISNNYIGFGESAMPETTSTSILYGRPYGGVATLIKKTLVPFCCCKIISERLVALELFNTLLVNVYFPCDDGSIEAYDIILDILSDITSVIEDNSFEYLYLGGDLNCDLNSKKKHSELIKKFLTDFRMSFKTPMDENNLPCPTFYDTKGCSSTIDFICFSNDLLQYVSLYLTVSDFDNFSDHEPVMLTLLLPTSHYISVHMCQLIGPHLGLPPKTTSRVTSDVGQLRFDHAKLNEYYECTRVLLQPIADKLNLALNVDYAIGDSVIADLINSTYNCIVDALNRAATIHVPRTKKNGLKFWWNAELNELKQKAMLSHKLWTESGKPRYGPVFDLRTRDKLNYKAVIKSHKINEKKKVSCELSDLLLQKESRSFWSTWKRKVCKTNEKLPCIDGCFDETINNEKFRKFFEKTCTVNTNAHDTNMRNLFLSKMSRLSNDVIDNSVQMDMFNVNIISQCVSKLKAGKAPGFDGLQVEHLVNAHPILYYILSKLFYIMMRYSYVPNDFGQGILVPIPKESKKRGIMSVDQFRGITISPVISKLFEHSLMNVYKKYLLSSERQFGFKNKIGCTSAILCVRKVVDFFVDNESTVNVCCLDISKAFDRVNNFGLLLKLVDAGAPTGFILILHNWLNKSFCSVRWGDVVSESFQLTAGVRQGGVLSAPLFTFFVDIVLTKLDNYGCKMHGLNVGSFMYADDLVLLSPCISELQVMINIVCQTLADIDLKLNSNKSCCIRIGKRCYADCTDVQSSFGPIPWMSKTSYLGIEILKAPKFSICYDNVKSNFYSSFNALYGKLGAINDVTVSLKLVFSIALPCLLYAQEALPQTNAIFRSIELPWSRAFMKIFSTFDMKIVQQCQFYTGFLPVEHYARLQKLNFFKSLKTSPSWFLRCIYDFFSDTELECLCKFYNVAKLVLLNNPRQVIDNFFVNTISNRV